MPRLSGSIVLVACLAIAATPVLAAQYDIKEMTPAVQQALEGRKARYAELRGLKADGKVGEDNQGLVEGMVGDAPVEQLVRAENDDRLVIYRAIVEQNQLGADGLALVKKAFAEVQREKAQPGDPIQLPSGDWAKK